MLEYLITLCVFLALPGRWDMYIYIGGERGREQTRTEKPLESKYVVSTSYTFLVMSIYRASGSVTLVIARENTKQK